MVIFKRIFRQDEHLHSLVSDVSSLSTCHNNMQYSCPELFVPEFALPISTSSFLAVTSQQSSVTTYGTWKDRYSDFAVTDAILVLPHGHLLLFYLLCLHRHFSTERIIITTNRMPGCRGFLCLLFGTSPALIQQSPQEKQAKIQRKN